MTLESFLEAAWGFIKVFLGLIFFAPIVLSNIYLAVAMKPWEQLWPKHKVRYLLLSPFLLIPWAFNFCFFHIWEGAFK